jgi:hypothetical protein
MDVRLSTEDVSARICIVRGKRVMLDRDLATLYGVETKVLNQAVRRNLGRFPDDFMFQLTASEHESLRSQNVTLETGRGRHRKYLPLVFTQEGVAMLSGVLSSARAVQTNIAIMRAFVKFREMLSSHQELAQKIDLIERRYDDHFKSVFVAIRQLMAVGSPLTQKRIKALGSGK